MHACKPEVRGITIYRAMHVPTYQLAKHYFRSLMSAPLKCLKKFEKGVCLRKFPLLQIVGPPWKEGEIRLGVDKWIFHSPLKLTIFFSISILTHFCIQLQTRVTIDQ